jgi:hypothetical protein
VTAPISETTVLNEEHRDRIWKSTLTKMDYRWGDNGWERVSAATGQWVPVRAGVHTETVYAHATEKFVEVS